MSAVGAGKEREQAIGSDAAVAIAERRRGRFVEGLRRLMDEEVVARRVQLGEMQVHAGTASGAPARHSSLTMLVNSCGSPLVPSQVMRGSRRNHMR